MSLQAFVGVMVITCVVLIAGIAAGINPAHASHTTVHLDPSPLYLAPGGSSALDVWVRGLNDTNGLGRFDITLVYDPSVITVGNVEGGDPPFDGTSAVRVDKIGGELNLSGAQPGAGTQQDMRGQIAPVTGMDTSVTITNAVVKMRSGLVPLGGAATLPVSVDFESEGGLAGYNISIAYDPKIVEMGRILPGDAPFGGTPIFEINEAEGFVNIVGFHGNRPGPTGETMILRISLRGWLKG